MAQADLPQIGGFEDVGAGMGVTGLACSATIHDRFVCRFPLLPSKEERDVSTECIRRNEASRKADT